MAIPSYRRAALLRDQTLALLRRHGVARERITVFVADEVERSEYAAVLDSETYGALHVGVPGIAPIRNFMVRHYVPGTQILFIDDDIRELMEFDAGCHRGLRPLQDLQSFVSTAFAEAARTGFRLWGIYLIDNGYFMRSRATTDLRYIVGCFFGLVNPGPVLEITQPFKEDFERSISMYLLDGGVLRFNHVTPVTRYWTTPGGNNVERKRELANEAALALHRTYPDLTRLRKKKSGVDVRLCDVRAEKRFGVDVLRAYRPCLDALLEALQAKRWRKMLRRNVYAKPCFTELAHAGNENAHILDLALDAAPHRSFTYAQLNRSVAMERHVDKYNYEGSLIVLLGDFEGGALCFDDGRRFAEKGVWFPFDGHQPHWVEPFEGERFSVVLFNSPILTCRLQRYDQGRETQRRRRLDRLHQGLGEGVEGGESLAASAPSADPLREGDVPSAVPAGAGLVAEAALEGHVAP